MLKSKGFDLWAEDYDKEVGISDEEGSYPFAGYKEVLNTIYQRILASDSKTVLDIGFGTGVLAYRLYENGCCIYGQDFSRKMIETAQKKMPDAILLEGDFTQGLVEPLTRKNYDAIVATYSLHHLTDEQKVSFIHSLVSLLSDHGCIYIGDIAFENRLAMEQCKEAFKDRWDEDEIYFVIEELKQWFPALEFEKISFCAGLILLKK